MKLHRTGKLVRNLIVLLLGLTVLWFWMGRPLPMRLDYRRQEQAQLMEPKEVLQWCEDRNCAVSRDEENLYLYSKEWDARIDAFPMTDGVGRALLLPSTLQVMPQDRPADPFLVIAYEESGTAVRAAVTLTTWAEPFRMDGELYQPSYIYEAEAIRDQELFFLEISCQEPLGETGVTARGVSEATLLEDLWDLECAKGYRWFADGGYEMTVTFYDAAGSEVAIHESGGTFPENE